MKYVGELSLVWLVILALYAVVPTVVQARALDADNYIPENDDDNTNDEGPIQDLEDNFSISKEDLINIAGIVELYLANKEKSGASFLWNRPVDPLETGFGGFYPSKRSADSPYDAVARDYYARAALKRNVRNELRNALAAKRSYHNPVDIAGGHFLGSGIFKGTGR
uniref:Neuropeptide 37 n=1 Tax=Holothuria leucospilota TaxID=206669 RepID=A0A5B8X9Q6_HOLLE|nr:neuropeptide 37 [Holothuria leucospilota]